ncbi:DUF839 domain-containing protein [Escherichia coli]|nr:DUF839 domain-containing protein [Escherichia coli]
MPWAGEVVRPSSFARRITVNTPMKITGPALHNPLMQTVDDPKGGNHSRHHAELCQRIYAVGHRI